VESEAGKETVKPRKSKRAAYTPSFPELLCELREEFYEWWSDREEDAYE
jgi:hypothetical protein